MFGTRIIAGTDDLAIDTLAHLSPPDFRDMNDYATAAVDNIRLGNPVLASVLAQLAWRIARRAYDAEITRREGARG